MHLKHFAIGLLAIWVTGCKSTPNNNNTANTETYPEIKIVGAMKNVMWKGELGSSINLDTIADKNGLYGLGPVSFLTGELLINNGKSYVSKVISDSTMTVEKTFLTSAPFFVYGNVSEWEEVELPAGVKTIQQLEKFIDDKSSER